MRKLNRLSLGTAVALVALFASGASLAGVPGTTSDFSCENCPLRVPDAGALAGTPELAEATTTVTAAACGGAEAVGGVQVDVDMTHAKVGDLRLRLITPTGTAFTLSDRVAQTGGAAGSCAGDDIDLTYDDGAGALQPSCGEQIPALIGVSKPVTGMNTLVGPIETGTWKLEVADYAANGDGTVDDWRLRFVCTTDLTIFHDGFED